MAAAPPDSPELRFWNNCTTFMKACEIILENLYESGLSNIDPKLVRLVEGFLGSYDKDEMIQKFITHSYSCWDKILSKDEDFFLNDAKEVFADLPMGKVDAFKHLFSITDEDGNPAVSEEEKEMIWSYFFSFIGVSISYVHEKREPHLIIKDGKPKRAYKTKFMQEVKTVKYSKLLDSVNLTWT